MIDRFLAPSRSFLLLCAALALVACGETHTGGTDAGGIMFDLDGAMLDGGVDAPIPPNSIGEACTTDTDCTAGEMCLDFGPDFTPGGYCSAACDPGGGDPMCPTGSTCVNFGGGMAYCLRDCDAGSTTRACPRAGYGCTTDPMLSGVCLGGCFDASDCTGTGLDCDPTGGDLGAGRCFDTTAAVGDACTLDTECPAATYCFGEDFSGVPGGACFGIDCDPVSNAGCETGSCFPGGRGGLCGAACTTDGDCRTGYTCSPVDGASPARSYCNPNCTMDSDCTVAGDICHTWTGVCDLPFNATNLGAVCSFRDEASCAGGTCLSEFQVGYPTAYCAYAGCPTPGDACPAEIGGVCVGMPPGLTSNYCFAACASDTDCRAGYACLPSIAGDPSSATACLPRCTDDTQCNTARGRTCNVTTGLCG